ncbi:MAG: M48 family peptidase, partial [Opitutales bacterium]
MDPVLFVFVALLLAKVSAGIWLDLLNLRHVRAHADEVPESFRDFIDLPDYRKSVEYTSAKTRFGIVQELFDAGVLALVLLTGLLAAIYSGL